MNSLEFDPLGYKEVICSFFINITISYTIISYTIICTIINYTKEQISKEICKFSGIDATILVSINGFKCIFKVFIVYVIVLGLLHHLSQVHLGLLSVEFAILIDIVLFEHCVDYLLDLGIYAF